MRKKTLIFMLVLALAVMAFAPMAMAEDSRLAKSVGVDIMYEYEAYQTEYGTKYDILPAVALNNFEMFNFVSIQAGKPILAPVYLNKYGQEYVLVSPSNQDLTLYWFWDWTGGTVTFWDGDGKKAELVPLIDDNFIQFGGQDAVTSDGTKPYFVRNLIPHNFPYWV